LTQVLADCLLSPIQDNFIQQKQPAESQPPKLSSPGDKNPRADRRRVPGRFR
jgi:hypothetical protein